MLIDISILLCGFSIFSLFILLIAYLFFLPDMRKSNVGKVTAAALLLSLVALQTGHYLFLNHDAQLLNYRSYNLLLLFIPTSFYFFSRVVLFADVKYQVWHLCHYLPFVLGFFLPITLIAPIGFMIGSAYTCWFAHQIFKLHGQSARFKFELFFFGLFAVIALITFALCLSLPYIQVELFYLSYANSISITIALIVCALLFYPKLLSDILLITELTYAKSKLAGVNTNQKIESLETLMNDEKLYQNDELSLSLLAEQLDLSTHQLSELINSHFNVNFPRYIREQRVNEAKRLLRDEPDSSVLAISMAIGFKSQSNFYTAFKEITGISPGKFRKKN